MNTYLEHPEPEIRLELLPSDLGDMKKNTWQVHQWNIRMAKLLPSLISSAWRGNKFLAPKNDVAKFQLMLEIEVIPCWL